MCGHAWMCASRASQPSYAVWGHGGSDQGKALGAGHSHWLKGACVCPSPASSWAVWFNMSWLRTCACKQGGSHVTAALMGLFKWGCSQITAAPLFPANAAALVSLLFFLNCTLPFFNLALCSPLFCPYCSASWQPFVGAACGGGTALCGK